MTTVHQIRLLPHQYEFIYAPQKIVALISGVGAGKSFAGRQWVIKKIAENPETTGFIGTNTHNQLRNTVLIPLFQELRERGIKYDFNQTTGDLIISPGTAYQARIICASLENFDSHRGIEIGWFYLDEIRDLRKEAFDMMLGRLRCKHATKLEGRCTTTPNGFDWVYDYFAGELKTDDFHFIHARTQDNVHLHESYISTLIKTYDRRFLEQELNGLFTNLKSGRLYHAFSRDRNLKEFERVGVPLKSGMDFNVNPMTGVIAEIHDGKIWVFDELYQEDSNTFKAAREMRQRFGRHITVYPDASGKARKTSASQSDHQILRDEGFEVRAARANPWVEDRVNTVNKLLEEGKIIIHPRCKMLIRDLEQVTHEKNPSHLTHISDALGYLAWAFQPITGRFEPIVTLR